MAKNLLIVESPAKAKTINKYLGKDFTVLASYGHVRDLVPKEGAVDTDNGFAMRYELIERNEKHVDAIAGKYIIEDETSDGAVMFVPAEAVFAEIHAYHGEVVDYANRKRVWIVSPTTLMAVLNTARAVLKDVETRKQVHLIKDALARLAVEFSRFDDRLKKLADHIRQAHDDAQKIQITGDKISQQFQRIEAAELEPPEAAKLKAVQ